MDTHIERPLSQLRGKTNVSVQCCGYSIYITAVIIMVKQRSLMEWYSHTKVSYGRGRVKGLLWQVYGKKRSRKKRKEKRHEFSFLRKSRFTFVDPT